MRSLFSLCFIIVTTISCSPAYAQNPQESMQFFPKNYVTKTGQANHQAQIQVPSPAESPGPTAPQSNTDTTALPPPEQALPAKEGIFEEAAGKPIKSIGAIWSTANPDTLRHDLEQLGSTVSNFGIAPGLLYLVGPLIDPGDFIEGPGSFAPLLAAGALPMAVQAVPPQYPVTRSPTWLVETTEGTILLEGVTNLSRYLNSRGEFVDRSLRFDPRKPSPFPRPLSP